jgi:hypothetical protein
MTILFFWIGFSVAVAVGANTRGRNPVGWFFLALVFSPLLAVCFLIALPKLDPSQQGGPFSQIE